MRILKTFFIFFLIFVRIPSGHAGDSANTMEVFVGEELVICLDSNPTTGYCWQLARAANGKILKMIRSEYIPSAIKMVGSPGKELWIFKAVGPGRTGVLFEYVRRWEKGIPPIEEKSFVVIAKNKADL